MLLYQQVVKIEPLRSEAYALGLRAEERSDDLAGVRWATVGILSQAWPVEFAEIEQAASRVVPAPACAVTRELEDGDRIDNGSGATVVHVPGHTPGSIAVHLPADGVLICGDTVASLNGRPIVGFFNCDPAQTRRSFVRIAGLQFHAAYFGHGAPLLEGARNAFEKVAARLEGGGSL